ncbi:MAG TPA: cyclase family protein [Verrucomicrobiae bacterium]|nr:cyclase family protein [Verrucomicrobiae bacterium]
MSAVGSIILLALIGCAFPKHAHDTSSLAEAWRIVSSKRFVDLTHTFGPNTPVWPGFGPATFSPAADPATGRPYTIEQDGFRASKYALVGQYGTHIDPPAHFDAKGRTLDELPVKEMILPLVVFDITPKLLHDPNYALAIADILSWEKVHGRIPAGAFAALRTDMSKDWANNPERFKRQPFPAWSPEAIRFLYEQRGIIANGHESMDTDATPDLQSEIWLLRHGHWQIELMANLDQVPTKGALIVVAWPKPEKGLGFPARAFAILP